jgi:hypothetical protein
MANVLNTDKQMASGITGSFWSVGDLLEVVA